jgi:hypothetical protein
LRHYVFSGIFIETNYISFITSDTILCGRSQSADGDTSQLDSEGGISGF